jgi:hypothetical protein
VRAFAVTHSVPSLGYTILAHKRKLLPDYRFDATALCRV